MRKPLSAKTIIEFLSAAKFNAEPIYVKTPSGDVLELTRMSMMTFDDDKNIYPIFSSQYTDIVADIDSSYGESGSELPPS